MAVCKWTGDCNVCLHNEAFSIHQTIECPGIFRCMITNPPAKGAIFETSHRVFIRNPDGTGTQLKPGISSVDTITHTIEVKPIHLN